MLCVKVHTDCLHSWKFPQCVLSLKVPDEAIFAEIHKSYFLRAFFSAAFNVPLKGECKEAL